VAPNPGVAAKTPRGAEIEMPRKCAYLSGAMSNMPSFNIPLFEEYEGVFRDMGFEVINPISLEPLENVEIMMNSPNGRVPKKLPDGVRFPSWNECLIRDLGVLARQADCVICLPGWENSRGARLEVYAAQLWGIPIYDVNLSPISEDILHRICGSDVLCD
jgi:hypothetical protein